MRKKFPVGAACEEAETERFINTVIAQAMPRLRHYSAYLASSRFSIESLMSVQQWIWDDLHLMWMGLGPGHREEFEDRLVPMWIEWKRLRQLNAAKAEQRMECING